MIAAVLLWLSVSFQVLQLTKCYRVILTEQTDVHSHDGFNT